MQACGNTPPLNIKSTSDNPFDSGSYILISIGVDKAQWSARMRLRWARLFNVPMDEQMPEGFPQSSLLVSTDSVGDHRSNGNIDAESALCCESQVPAEAGRGDRYFILLFFRRTQGSSHIE